MRVAIFEDEMHNAERLRQLLGKSGRPVEVITVISSVAEGLNWLNENHEVDLLLMDIQLSDGNCFELFSKCRISTPVIFTTAYDKFALEAFKVNSIDYLLKPVVLEELKKALDKLEVFRPRQRLDVEQLAEAFFRRGAARFIGKINNQLIYVKATEIAYLHFNKGITLATTKGAQQMPLDYSLDQLEKLLNKNEFFRINRQFIIHIDAISKIMTYQNNRYILKLKPALNTDVIVSRERVINFRNWLEGKT